MAARNYRELLSFLSHRLRDQATAADLAQESYARLYAAERAGTLVRDARALLYKTARNLLVDHHRRGQVRSSFEIVGSVESIEPDAHAGPAVLEPETALASKQGVAALVAAIDRLPPRCREAFVLSRFDGLNYAQVAERMGISVKTVEAHLKHALDACERFRTELHGDDSAATTLRRRSSQPRSADLNRSKASEAGVEPDAHPAMREDR